jgi:hypothetical protein
MLPLSMTLMSLLVMESDKVFKQQFFASTIYSIVLSDLKLSSMIYLLDPNKRVYTRKTGYHFHRVTSIEADSEQNRLRGKCQSWEAKDSRLLRHDGHCRKVHGSSQAAMAQVQD